MKTLIFSHVVSVFQPGLTSFNMQAEYSELRSKVMELTATFTKLQ